MQSLAHLATIIKCHGFWVIHFFILVCRNGFIFIQKCSWIASFPSWNLKNNYLADCLAQLKNRKKLARNGLTEYAKHFLVLKKQFLSICMYCDFYFIIFQKLHYINKKNKEMCLGHFMCDETKDNYGQIFLNLLKYIKLLKMFKWC